MAGRLRYTEGTFTLPTCEKRMTDLEYSLRVGLISQEQYDSQFNLTNGTSASTQKGLSSEGGK